VSRIRFRGAWLRGLWTTLAGRQHPPAAGIEFSLPGVAPDETLIAYLEQHPLPLADNSRDLPMSATAYLAASRARLLVPLVVQRHLVGLLSLGEPMSGGAYSSDDLVFLSTLADEAAAAVTIVQLTNHEVRAQSPLGNTHDCSGVSSPTSS
jgi:GAF domain-containing protein